MSKIDEFYENIDFTKQQCCLSDHLSNTRAPQIYVSEKGDPQLSFKIRFVFLSILFVILRAHEVECNK